MEAFYWERVGLQEHILGSASVCLNNTKVEEMIYSYLVQFETGYEEVDKIKYYCETNSIKIEKIEYLEKILFKTIIKPNDYGEFEKNVKNMLSRNVDFSIVEEKYVKK